MMEPHEPRREDTGVPSAPLLTDAHCHLDFPAFDADREATLASCRALGIGRHVFAGYTPASARVALAFRDDRTRVCAGLHPWALADWPESDDEAKVASLEAVSRGADALGEIGLDEALASRGVPIDRQLRVARAALAVAERSNSPLVLHVVGAHAAMQALVTEAGRGRGVMVHAFEASAAEREGWLRLGAHLSVGRAVLDPRRSRAREAAMRVPLDRLLLESDAPAGRTPHERRVEPTVLLEVAREVAELRAISVEALARATSANAARLFGFDPP